MVVRFFCIPAVNLSKIKKTIMEDDDIHLNQKSVYCKTFKLGFDFYSFGVAASMSDEFFLSSLNSSDVEVQSVTLPSFPFNYQKKVYEYKNANLSIKIGGILFLPYSGPNIKTDLGEGGSFEFQAKLVNQFLRVGYDVHALRASEISTVNKNIYWMYVWENF